MKAVSHVRNKTYVRAALVIATIAASLAAGASPAAAGVVTLTREGTLLEYHGLLGETNRVLVTHEVSSEGPGYLVSDASKAGVIAGEGCVTVTGWLARCDVGWHTQTSIEVTMGDQNDSFESSVGGFLVDGGAGNDVFVNSSYGGDIFVGGSGRDRVEYFGPEGDDYQTCLMVDLDDMADDGSCSLSGETREQDNVHADVEDVWAKGYFYRVLLVGNAVSNTLRAGGRGPGQHTLIGRGGVDYLVGGATDDVLNGEDGRDFLIGAAGNDVLDGGTGDDDLRGGEGADVFVGGDGRDLADYSFTTIPVRVDLDGQADDGARNERDNVGRDVEVVWGGVSHDLLFGDDDADVLVGFAGNDRLYGLKGSDRLFGGAGNDTLDGGPGFDTCLQGAGTGPMISC